MSVEDLLLKTCVWHNSLSIIENNEMWKYCCGGGCDGLSRKKYCQYYINKKDYFQAKLEACKKINTEKQKE